MITIPSLPLGFVLLIPMREKLEGIYFTPIIIWNYSPSIPPTLFNTLQTEQDGLIEMPAPNSYLPGPPPSSVVVTMY